MATGYNFTNHLEAGVRPYRVSQALFSVLFFYNRGVEDALSNEETHDSEEAEAWGESVGSLAAISWRETVARRPSRAMMSGIPSRTTHLMANESANANVNFQASDCPCNSSSSLSKNRSLPISPPLFIAKALMFDSLPLNSDCQYLT